MQDKTADNALETVRGFSPNGELSDLEQVCISSFLANGHPYVLYTYEKKPAGVPAGATVVDARELVPDEQFGTDWQNKELFLTQLRYQSFGDLGGWWADEGIVCLRPLVFAEPYVFAGSSVHTRRDVTVIDDVVKLPQGSAFAAMACDYVQCVLDGWFDRMSRVALLAWLVGRCRLLDFVKPHYMFRPYSDEELAYTVACEGDIPDDPDAYTLNLSPHLCVVAQVDTNSIYSKLKQRYIG